MIRPRKPVFASRWRIKLLPMKPQPPVTSKFSISMLSLLLQIGSCPDISPAEIAFLQEICPDAFPLSRGMDDLSLPGIDAHMGDLVPPSGEKDEVPFFQRGSVHRVARRK